MIEKPKPEEAPTTLSITGPLYSAARNFRPSGQKQKRRGRRDSADRRDGRFAGWQQLSRASAFDGKRYDCGHKLGFIEANIAFALDRDDMRDDVIGLLETYLKLAKG
jgi:UTP--glucose-1-phosphate uridylyltransferase